MTVSELEERMPSSEVTEWRAEYELRQWEAEQAANRAKQGF